MTRVIDRSVFQPQKDVNTWTPDIYPNVIDIESKLNQKLLNQNQNDSFQYSKWSGWKWSRGIYVRSRASRLMIRGSLSSCQKWWDLFTHSRSLDAQSAGPLHLSREQTVVSEERSYLSIVTTGVLFLVGGHQMFWRAFHPNPCVTHRKPAQINARRPDEKKTLGRDSHSGLLSWTRIKSLR